MNNRALGVILAAGLVLIGGCGNDKSALDSAQDKMADLDAGRIDLQLSATAGSDDPTDPVGFRVAGPFSFASGNDKAVFDLTYSQLLGGEETETQVASTGTAVYVVAGGKTTEVSAEVADAFTLGDKGEGLTDFAIADWIVDPKQSEDDGTQTVTGKVNVSEFLSDLSVLSGDITGNAGARQLDDEGRKRLDGLAKSTEAKVIIDKEGLPRSTRIVVDFGADVPEELPQALGPYASARLELTLKLEPLTQPLVVKKPS